MSGLFKTVKDVEADCQVLKNRAYGVIEVCDQEFEAIHMRPYPKLVSLAEVKWSNLWKKQLFAKTSKDRVLLYYNQPILHRNFLALKYFVSDYKSTLATIAVSLSVLDYIAMVKRTDAIVTEITNDRIKDRHLQHFGWEEHQQNQRGRHWIKRFYGQYPESFLFRDLKQSEPEKHPENLPTGKREFGVPVIVSSPNGNSAASSTQSQVQ